MLWCCAGPQFRFEATATGMNEAQAFNMLGLSKELRYWLSQPADDDGLAAFSHLGFTDAGPAGDYRITYFLVGSSVQSSVMIHVRLVSATQRVSFQVVPNEPTAWCR